MDIHPTPFPDPKFPSKIAVKSQYMKPRSTRKLIEAPKSNRKGVPPLLSERRVFGTARNPNIPIKTAPPPKPAKGKPGTGSLIKAVNPPASEAEESLSGKNQNPKKKKSVCFQENNKAGNFVEPRTPAKSPAVVARSRLSVTPYRSAERCSKCRFDRLESSSYWISQIKLGEAVGKHFVSAAFFRLAYDCEAEPIRNIRVELKKYLTRHEYLNEEEEWKKLYVSYGVMVKEDNNGLLMVKEDNGREVTAVSEEENASNQEGKDLVREIAEDIENLEIV